MLTKFRKNTALLLSVAVVCATVALVPQTAGAAASKAPAAGTTADPYSAPASTTAMKACPMSSAAAAGFTDTTSTDVDCIKMFGITTGKTATTYDPSGTISRQDMARFIHRMFVPTGMAAAGLTAVPAFTDIAHVDAGGTAAINALASHGITLGTTATTFSPDSNVTREQMALFLYRFAQIVGAYDDATPSGITMDIATKKYNYSDIAATGFESMEAIIGLYNAGVTGETCIATTVTTCGTTYRPTEDITRAEMASMLTALLNHTNARPAGVSIQNSAAVAAGSVTTTISCRNADFTPNSNTLVDSFQQVRTDTSATTIAASVPFVAVTNVVNTSTGGVGGASTPGTMDTGDKLCGVKGNVAGTAQTLAADQTGRWWAWTAAQGTVYVDGTTTAFLFETSLAAGSTTTFATTATHAWDNPYATATNFGGTIANVTATDGSNTYQGTSRTITTTLTGATTAAVVDGYTVKYVDKVVSYGGGTGNQSVVYNTTYVASSAGKTSLTVTCSADPLPTTNNAAAPGTITALEYYESHEVTITFATAAAGNGWPVGGSDPTDAGLMHNSTMNLSCDDVARAYPGGDAAGSETLSVGTNYADVSTGGTLASITATAYDQYGVGIAGITARFDSVTATNVAKTAISVAGAQERATLTTGADGTATLTAVVCTANGYVSWALHADGTMDAKTAAVPAATTTEGTVIYCTAPGTDTVTVDTANTNVAAGVTEIQTIVVYEADGTTTCDATSGTWTITYDGEAGDPMEHDADNTDAAARMNSNANLSGVTAAVTGGHTFAFTFRADTGNHPALVGALTTTMADSGSDNCTVFTTTETTAGVNQTTFDFIDDDLTNNSFVTIKTVEDGSTTGAAVVTTTYQRWTYDSGDTFAVGTALANQGQTEAAFETANAAISNLTTNVALTYRTGATSTGQSHFSVGN